MEQELDLLSRTTIITVRNTCIRNSLRVDLSLSFFGSRNSERDRDFTTVAINPDLLQNKFFGNVDDRSLLFSIQRWSLINCSYVRELPDVYMHARCWHAVAIGTHIM